MRTELFLGPKWEPTDRRVYFEVVSDGRRCACSMRATLSDRERRCQFLPRQLELDQRPRSRSDRRRPVHRRRSRDLKKDSSALPRRPCFNKNVAEADSVPSGIWNHLLRAAGWRVLALSGDGACRGVRPCYPIAPAMFGGIEGFISSAHDFRQIHLIARHSETNADRHTSGHVVAQDFLRRTCPANLFGVLRGLFVSYSNH